MYFFFFSVKFFDINDIKLNIKFETFYMEFWWPFSLKRVLGHIQNEVFSNKQFNEILNVFFYCPLKIAHMNGHFSFFSNKHGHPVPCIIRPILIAIFMIKKFRTDVKFEIRFLQFVKSFFIFLTKTSLKSLGILPTEQFVF